MEKMTFEKYGLGGDLLKSLSLLNYKEPTKVQQEVIPAALGGKDIVVNSKTGSGKTAAFAIPICEKVVWEENTPQAIVLTPTRELAMQIKEDFFNIGRFKRVRPVALYGKAPFFKQQKELKQKTHVIVGTPGRVMDHLERGTWDTQNIKYLIIDEADEMLKMGFIEQVGAIINRLPKDRITMLFSATMSQDIENISKKYMKQPEVIGIELDVPKGNQIEQIQYPVSAKDKMALLEKLTIVENPDSCIVFCNTKQQVDDVEKELVEKDYTCSKIHGGMEQRDREQVMEDFRKGYFRYLVATDVAARGIDIEHITHVINYDVPENIENYVHRIGRTGRAGRKGKAITLVAPNEKRDMKAVESYTGHAVEVGERPDDEKVAAARPEFTQKLGKRLKNIDTKAEQINQEIIKLHINAGKKTKMRPGDIVGALCNIPDIKQEDIGIISVVDVSTFVEILNNKGEAVLLALQTMPIKGRIRRVTKSEK
ncbi:MAG: DEAD/DEAH box helicase [Cellulosilyticaceae bacterium]